MQETKDEFGLGTEAYECAKNHERGSRGEFCDRCHPDRFDEQLTEEDYKTVRQCYIDRGIQPPEDEDGRVNGEEALCYNVIQEFLARGTWDDGDESDGNEQTVRWEDVWVEEANLRERGEYI